MRRFDDRWTHEDLYDVILLGDDLLGERLRICIDVRPTPVFGTLGTKLGRTLADPHFALAEDGGFQFGFVVRIAALFYKAIASLLAELCGLYRVVGFLPRLLA